MEWLTVPLYKNMTIDDSVITDTLTQTITNNFYFYFEQLIDDNSIETMDINSPAKRKTTFNLIS